MKPVLKQKQLYNFAFLQRFCGEHDLQLLKDYSRERVSSNIKIEAKCICCENKMVEKSFGKLVKNKNFGCKECSIGLKKTKIKQTMMERYGVEYAMQSKEVKTKSKQTMMERYGVKHAMQSEDVKTKSKQTMMERYGVEYAMQSEDVKTKIKQTCMERYGVENAMQSEDVQTKSKQTCMERYGVDHSFQAEEVKTKIKQTCMERYGVENAFQSEDVQTKSKQTCMERYGVENAMQSEDVQTKSKQTMMERYGVEHAMQNPLLLEKQQQSACRLKEYTFPSGRIDTVQGYEPFALNDLMEYGIDEDEIVTGKDKVPDIWYLDEDGKRHRYYVDIYIPCMNLCIEVKSDYTFIVNPDMIQRKMKACVDANYVYEIWVYDAKGRRNIPV